MLAGSEFLGSRLYYVLKRNLCSALVGMHYGFWFICVGYVAFVLGRSN